MPKAVKKPRKKVIQPKKAFERRAVELQRKKQPEKPSPILLWVAILLMIVVYTVHANQMEAEKDYVALPPIPDEIFEKAEGVTYVGTVNKPSGVYIKNSLDFIVPSNIARLVIIIDDLGYISSANRRLARLKGPLTLSYLPYADNLQPQVNAAIGAGHEIMVHIPMAPHREDADPGPHSLLANMSKKDFQRELSWNLNRFKGYAGVNNHMGSLLTEETKEMTWLMEHLKKENLMFLDSRTTTKSVAYDVAKEMGLPTLNRDVFIDNNRTINQITAQLDYAKNIALENGYAIAIGHPYEETLDALEVWLKTLDKSMIALVPLSAVMKEHYQK